MTGKGIDHSTCPKARVVGLLWSGAERAFAEVLVRALRRKVVVVFLKVRVLDVIELVGEGYLKNAERGTLNAERSLGGWGSLGKVAVSRVW